MKKNDINLSDEEMERILNDYKSKNKNPSSENPEERSEAERNNKKSKKTIDEKELKKQTETVQTLREKISAIKTNRIKRFYYECCLCFHETKLSFIKDGDHPDNPLILLLICILLPYDIWAKKTAGLLLRCIASPFMREYVFSCCKFSLLSLIVFFVLAMLMALDYVKDDWFLLVLFFFVVIPLGILIALVGGMPTPALEYMDKRKGYPAITSNMSVGSVDSFRTAITGGDELWEPLTQINLVSEKEYHIFPVMLQCNVLSEDHEPKSSLKQKPISLVTNYDIDDNEIAGVFVSNQMNLTKDQKSEYRFPLKLLLEDELLDLLNELLVLEPSMEFRYSFLKFSNLLLRIEPIDHYVYHEKTDELLEKINERIHPWLNRKRS